MIGYIQSQDCFGDRLLIGPIESQLVPSTQEGTKGLPLVGHFANVNGEQVLLYRWSGQLSVRFGQNASQPLAGLSAEWWHQVGKAHFLLKKGEQVLVERCYPLSPDIISLPDDPTPFAEVEDFDFLLFIRNVVTNPVRSASIYLPQK